MSTNKTRCLSLAEKFFSVRNEGTRKVICILGLKIRFRTPRLVYRELNARLDQVQDVMVGLQTRLDESQSAADKLKARIEQQTEELQAACRAGLERQAQDINSRITEIYANLMYRIHEYCPEEKRAAALKDWYFEKTGETLNLDNPQTFNEKIQWLKLYDSTPIKTLLADKYAVRGWIKEKIGEQYLIPLLGVWNTFEEIDFDRLPDRFVLKCNHGSGYNIIVKDKSKLDMGGLSRQFKSWMNEDFSSVNCFELQYLSIPRKIIAEKYIKDDKDDFYEYELWCFDGKVKYIECLFGQHTSALKSAFYDLDWHKQNFIDCGPIFEDVIEKPDNLDLMISLAEKLADGFIHVRVDFYGVNNRIYFGELTFTTLSGLCSWRPKEKDLEFGQMIKLPH